MTITNREVFYRDPTKSKIPNDGVAQVVRPETDQQWDVFAGSSKLRVRRPVRARPGADLRRLPQQSQPVTAAGRVGERVLRQRQIALVRVLEYLWRDSRCPAASRARSLARSRRSTRLTSPSCRQRANASAGCGRRPAHCVRQERRGTPRLLVGPLRKCRLPPQYPHARFAIWAQQRLSRCAQRRSCG